MTKKHKTQKLRIIHLLLGDYAVESRVRNQTEVIMYKYDAKICVMTKKIEPQTEKLKNVQIIRWVVTNLEFDHMGFYIFEGYSVETKLDMHMMLPLFWYSL